LRKENFVSGECISFVFAGLNEPESFFEYLDIAVSEKTIGQYLLRYLPMFDAFRSDERFARILRKANLPTA